jgi:poly(A) polymerase
MAESQKHWGVTGSISFARPTEEEVAANGALIEELKSQGSFESAEESQRRFYLMPTSCILICGRVKVLAELQQLTIEFVRKVSLNKNMTESMATEAGGKIFTFGSYRLGVYGPGVFFPEYVF